MTLITLHGDGDKREALKVWSIANDERTTAVNVSWIYCVFTERDRALRGRLLEQR